MKLLALLELSVIVDAGPEVVLVAVVDPIVDVELEVELVVGLALEDTGIHVAPGQEDPNAVS